MQFNVSTLGSVLSFILFTVTYARETNINSTWRFKPPAETVRRNIAENEHDSPSRLATALPLASKERPSMPLLPEGTNGQRNVDDSVPVESQTQVPKAANLIESERPDNNNTISGSLEDNNTVSEVVSNNNFNHLTLSENGNGTVKRQSIAPQEKPNKTEETRRRTVSSIPTKPPETALNSGKASNRSAGHPVAVASQPSKLLVSVQTVNRAQIPRANVSELDSVANKTVNHSAVLISNTREIEVVIIANKPPQPAPKEATREFQPPAANHAPSRRFPAGVPYPNGTFLGARRPLPARYASRHYWPVYLTLTLLSLSVLAICVVCCTSRGRRDMSIPPQKPVQYGHQLPPYSYAFSHEMRQTDSQETARLNPAASNS